MPITLLPIGVPTVIAQTTAYALPTRTCTIRSTAVLEFNLVSDTTGFAAVTATTTGTTTGGAKFVRCTGSTAIVNLSVG